MGQKVNPHGLRVGVIKDWDSRWYAKNELVGDLLVEDKKIRDYLKKTLYGAGIPKIEIERDNAKVRIYLHCARPGVVIGKGGEEIKGDIVIHARRKTAFFDFCHFGFNILDDFPCIGAGALFDHNRCRWPSVGHRGHVIFFRIEFNSGNVFLT